MVRFLGSNRTLLQFLWLLPKEHPTRNNNLIQIMSLILFAFIPVVPAYLCTVFDCVMQFLVDEPLNITKVAEDLVFIVAISEMFVAIFLFLYNRSRFVKLANILPTFYGFGPPPKAERAELIGKRTWLGLMIYGYIGLFMYFLAPVINYQNCVQQRRHEKASILSQPCGLVNRCYLGGIPFDEYPMYYVVLIDQLYTSVMFVKYTVALNMPVCSLIMHLVAHLKHHRKLVVEAIDHEDPMQRPKLLYKTVRYHYAILTFHKEINKCYTYYMLMHISCTTFVISTLGFEMITVDSFWDNVRFVIYFFGWVGILAILCFFGQLLLDESTKMPYVIHNSKWTDTDTKFQKDLLLVIIRTQRALKMEALSFGSMSYETFVGVMSTSYSYFTLLLHFMRK